MKWTLAAFAVLAALMLSLLAPTTANAQNSPINLVQNPGFETGMFSLTPWQATTTGTAMYQVSSNAPHDGFFGFASGVGSGTVTLTQTISTTPGRTYTFLFWALAVASPVPYQVYWGEQQIASLSLPSATSYDQYQKYMYTVTATTASTQIRFVGNSNSNSVIFLDDVSVSEVLPVPNAVNDSYTVARNGTLVIDAAQGLLANDTDPNNEDLDVTRLVSTTNLNGDISVNNETGAFTYTPDTGYIGTASFTYEITNPQGGLDTATATINVIGVPTANNQNVSVSHNTARAITLTGSDPNSPPRSLTYSVQSNPSRGTLSGTAPNLTYTPNTGYQGTDSFTFRVNNGVANSSTATVSITVAAAVPTANSQSVTTNQNTAKAITLTGSDANVPALPLTYTVTAGPTRGTLSGTAPNLTYTPTAGYVGSDSFQFRVSNGAANSGNATVSITVVGAPTASSQSVSVSHDTAKAITLSGSDPNSPPRSLIYTVTGNPSHGTLSGTAPNLTYTPTAGYQGSDSFPFKVNNGTLDSSTATVNITVSPGAPTASSQSVSTSMNMAKAVTLTGADSNTPPLSLTYTVTANPAHGTLSGTAPNLTYTPTAGYFGSDSFQFKVNNGSLDSNAATVSITVNATTTDVTGSIQVTKGAFTYNRAAGSYSQQVTLTNTGGTDIAGPISLILSNLANGTLTNASGTTSALTPTGSPYVSTGGLTAGASVTLNLLFTKAGTGTITYDTQTVAGPGPR
jgi:hypothetical protein